jgi:hypothetical protein
MYSQVCVDCGYPSQHVLIQRLEAEVPERRERFDCLFAARGEVYLQLSAKHLDPGSARIISRISCAFPSHQGDQRALDLHTHSVPSEPLTYITTAVRKQQQQSKDRRLDVRTADVVGCGLARQPEHHLGSLKLARGLID